MYAKDNRLKFRYQFESFKDGVTQARSIACDWKCMSKVVGRLGSKSPKQRPRADR